MPHISFEIPPDDVDNIRFYAHQLGGTVARLQITFAVPLERVTPFTEAMREAGAGPIEVELSK